MHVVFRHAWMQKHPTPTNKSGDFHWHPAGVPTAIRSTLTELSTRTRGQTASLWIIDESYVAWARAFATVSPGDERRYTGLAATIAQTDKGSFAGALPEIMARMPLAQAGPFAGQTDSESTQFDAMPGSTRPLAVAPDSLLDLFDDCDHDLAAALYLGGQVFSREPHAERLPALVGRLLTWIPAHERTRPRTGVFVDGRAGREARSHSENIKNFFHYLTAAWFCPEPIRQRRASFAMDTWQLVFDLSAALSCTLPDLFAELTRVAAAWDTAAGLREHIVATGALSTAEIAECDRRAPGPLLADSAPDAGWLWNRLMHYWGRGFLPGDARSRLAALLAQRIAVDHLFHLDAPAEVALPRRYLRRLAYESLLPREHVAAMRNALGRYVPSLSATSEVPLV